MMSTVNRRRLQDRALQTPAAKLEDQQPNRGVAKMRIIIWLLPGLALKPLDDQLARRS